jgi:sugar phosphate isomerase/epimerase
MFEVACSTYAHMGLPLEEALNRIKADGFDYAELVLHDSPEWGHLRPADIIKDPDGSAGRVKMAMENSGIRMLASTVSLYENVPWQRGEFEAVCRFLRDLRIHIATIPAGRGNERMEMFRLRDLRDLAAKYGVMLAVEPQSMMVWGNSLFLLPYEAASFAEGESGHKLTLDTGHLIRSGTRQEDWKQIFKWIVHIHLRDARPGPGESQVPYGQGLLDLGSLVRSLRAAGYSGSFTVEYLKGWGEGLEIDAAKESASLRDSLVDVLAQTA